MGRKRRKAPPRKSQKTFRVTSEEKQQLLASVEEAERGGSLPFDEALAEVRRKTDEMLARDEAPSFPGK